MVWGHGAACLRPLCNVFRCHFGASLRHVFGPFGPLCNVLWGCFAAYLVDESSGCARCLLGFLELCHAPRAASRLGLLWVAPRCLSVAVFALGARQPSAETRLCGHGELSKRWCLAAATSLESHMDASAACSGRGPASRRPRWGKVRQALHKAGGRRRAVRSACEEAGEPPAC